MFLDKIKTIKCCVGGTDLNGLMGRVIDMPGVAAFTYIGDCFEEDEKDAFALARQFKLKGIKPFFFHDKSSQKFGYDTVRAGKTFAKIVDICGVAVFDFNDQAPKQTEDVLGGIALYAVGGKKLLEQKRKEVPGAALLLEHLK